MNVTRYRCSVLAVDDDPAILALLTAQLGTDFEVIPACTVGQARGVFAERSIDILVSDLHLPDDSGLVLLDWARRASPRTARLLLTGAARLEDAVDAINQAQVHRLVLKPWRGADLLQTLQAMGRGLLLERSHEELLDELRRLNQELEQRVAERTRELEVALAQIQQKNRILEQMALTDPLTQISNRRAIDLIARKELLRRVRTPCPIALGMIDADHFGRMNKDYTQIGGDHVLAWLAKVLNDAIRASDSLGRVGGEEFMVVAPETDLAGAAGLAERLRAHVEGSSTQYGGHTIRMTVSIGFAAAAAGTTVGYDQLREAAAAALKEAKETGRNKSVVRAVSAGG
jgi:diguanylate cyclase (GGDEF)-like protein